MTVEGESQIFEFQKSFINKLQIGILTMIQSWRKRHGVQYAELEIFYLTLYFNISLSHSQNKFFINTSFFIKNKKNKKKKVSTAGCKGIIINNHNNLS